MGFSEGELETMNRDIQPRDYETIVAKGGAVSTPNNLVSTTLAMTWDVGDTVILAAMTYAFATPATVSAPGVPAGEIEFVYNTGETAYIHLYVIRKASAAFSGLVTITRPAGGVLHCLGQVYSGVGRVILQNSQLPAVAGTPTPGGPVTTTVPNSWVLGLFAVGANIAWNAPYRRLAFGTSAGTWYGLSLTDQVAVGPGTYQASQAFGGVGPTAGVTRLGLGLEPGQIGGQPADFDISISPDTIALTPGDPAREVTVTIDRMNGFAESVTLSSDPWPAFIDHFFVPATLNNPDTVSLLTAWAEEGAAAGLTLIPIVASGDGIEKTANLLVNVILPRPPLDPQLKRLATGLLLLKIPVEVG